MKINNLEELSSHLMDNWIVGNYSSGFNGEESLLSGRQMAEIFINEARKKFPGEEEAEIMYMADHLEEAINEGIANLQ